MFRRRSSTSKKSGEIRETPKSSLDVTMEEEDMEVSSRMSGSPTDILVSLLTPPVLPQVSMNSQIMETPTLVATDLIPSSLFKLCEWTLLFLLGSLGCSYAWVLLLATLQLARQASRDQSKRNTQLSPRVWKEREQDILHSLGPDSLPSWVTFPDTDRVEWINIILRKLWPNIGSLASQIALQLVEPKVNEILKRLSIKGINLETMSNFRIKQLVLGDIPARLGGIRVYDRNTTRDEIVMDIEVIYAGDARVKFSLQGIDCEINQVTVKTTARVVLKPLLPEFPVVGGLELYFISMPTLDYNLAGMAAAGDLPGVSNIIKSVLDSIIKRGFVWPNRFGCYFPMESVTRFQGQMFPMTPPQGVLCVEVREARNLVKKDKHLIGGKSDPYVVLSVGESRISFVDAYVDSDVNPVWNYEAQFPMDEPFGHSLRVEVYDYDTGSDDDFLGRVCVSVADIQHTGILQDWMTLDDTKHGEVHLGAVWRPVLEPGEEGERRENGCVVSVFVDSCSFILSGRGSPPYCKCEIMVGAGQGFKTSKKTTSERNMFQTKPRGPGECPVFQEGHSFVSRRVQTDCIGIQVSDHKSSVVLGRVSIPLSYLASLPACMFHKMDWPLEDSVHPEASISLSAKIYPF